MTRPAPQLETSDAPTATETLAWRTTDVGSPVERRAAWSYRARRIWDTTRHLTAGQIAHQIRRRIFPPQLVATAARVDQVAELSFRCWVGRDECWRGGGRFTFLNRAVDLGDPIDWTAEGLPHLWQYHLHYFDALGQAGIDAESTWRLMRDWIAHHQPRRGAVGWEPYPLSLRVVNWLKFLQQQREFPEDIVQSLALQGGNLVRQVESHLLGNHLFANGKALYWLGTFLNQDAWRQRGRRIVLSQLAEQFLPDGGHFELSPMYHALMLEDLLDLLNLGAAAGDSDATRRFAEYAARALSWLSAIGDAENRIPLLNDSAQGMARSVVELSDYAQRCGVAPDASGRSQRAIGRWSLQNLSGYQVVKKGLWRLIFDTARLGPDYLPGHAHADMLAVLFDFDGDPIFTDTGVLEYAEGRTRTYCRSTAAHNTVSIDGLDQAELWKSFRVGRRGRPGAVAIDGCHIRCAHDGFARQRPGLRHERTVGLLEDGFRLIDDVSGPGEHRYESRFHLAPDVEIRERDGAWWINGRLRLEFRGAVARLETTPYYPEFGQAFLRSCLTLSGTFHRHGRLELVCTSCS